MSERHDKRKAKRITRRNGEHRWYHNVIDFFAEVLWLGVDIPIMIFRVLWSIIKFPFRMLGELLEGIGSIFS